MGFLKRLRGGGDQEDATATGPDWAPSMSMDEASAFLEAVGVEIERRGLTFALGEGVIRIERNDEPSDYGLTNLAQVCHQAGRGSWTSIISDHFDNLFAAEAAQAELDERARDLDAVRPMLKVRLFPGASLGGMDAQEPTSWDEAPGLVAAFVYDLPTTVATVSASHIAGWGRSREELMAIALDNVRADAVETQRVGDGGASAMIACVADHYFAASHAFLLGERLPPEATHGAIFAVPHRHAMLYAPIVDLGVVQSLNRIIATAVGMFQQGPGAISPGLYWWRNGTISLLPAQLDGKKVAFAPPDEFIAVLNELAAPA